MQTQISKSAADYVSSGPHSPASLSSTAAMSARESAPTSPHSAAARSAPVAVTTKRPRTFWDTVMSDSGTSNNTSSCTTVPNGVSSEDHDRDVRKSIMPFSTSPSPSLQTSSVHSPRAHHTESSQLHHDNVRTIQGSSDFAVSRERSQATKIVRKGGGGGIDKPHMCTSCQSSFARLSHLRLHIRTIHDKLKPFQCDECPATFGHVSSKYRHYRTVHLKRRDFSCDRCGQSFAERSAVLKHCRTVHEGARPYPCRICGFRFHFKLHLAQHVATVHDKLRPHQCAVCNSCFGQRSSLNRHVRQIHGLATSGCAGRVKEVSETTAALPSSSAES